MPKKQNLTDCIFSVDHLRNHFCNYELVFFLSSLGSLALRDQFDHFLDFVFLYVKLYVLLFFQWEAVLTIELSLSFCTVFISVFCKYKWVCELVCRLTFCLNEHSPCQSEGFQLRRSHCQPGFLHLTGDPHPLRLHPHLDGHALSHCAALHRSDRCPPGLSACWHLIGSPIVRSDCRCHCVDCVARPRCHLQTAPIRQKMWCSCCIFAADNFVPISRVYTKEHLKKKDAR